MSEGERKILKDGYTVVEKGYAAPKESVNNGYKPESGSLGTPPTSGSAVAKPSPKKEN